MWGLGYISSECEEDGDEEAEEESPEDSAYNEDLKRRILKGPEMEDEFDMDEFDNISNNGRLREVYNYRWWKDNDQDNYFVMINSHFKAL